MRSRKSWHFLGHDFVVWTPDDLIDLSVVLKREFPGIRFLGNNKEFLVDKTRTDLLNAEPAKVPVPPGTFRVSRYVAKPESEWRMHYCESLADGGSFARCDAVLEPEGWVPQWKVNCFGHPYVANQPEFGFVVNKSIFSSNKYHTKGPSSFARSDDEVISLIQGCWNGIYRDDAPLQKKFLAKVKRLVAKLTTTEHTRVRSCTSEVLSRDKGGGPCRFGFHALAWARAHPNHFLDDSFKPIDWEPPKSRP